MLKKIIFTVVVACGGTSNALEFGSVSQSDMDTIVTEFSSNFSHNTVSSAGSLGKIFGVEVGLIAGATDTPEIKKLVQAVDPSEDVGLMPHAALMAMLSVPMGFTIEANLVPETGSDDFKFQNMSLGLKWTLTESIPLPADIAFRVAATQTELSFTQPVSGVNTVVKFEDTIISAQAIASVNLLVAEPYAGIGIVNGDGSLKVDGSGTIFDTAFTTSQEGKGKSSETQVFAGVEFKLLVIKIGAEINKIGDATRYTAKLSAFF